MINKKAHYVTCGQMRLLERRADASGLSYYEMMENAGTGAAAVILDRMKNISETDTAYGSFAESAGSLTDAAVAESSQMMGDAGKDSVTLCDASRTGRVYDAGDRLSVLMFCGKGNNGGDGFVMARVFHEHGCDVTVVLVDGRPVTPDASTNFKLIADMDITVLDMTEDDRAMFKLTDTPDIIVDAIYGTGFSGRLKGNGLKASIFIAMYRSKENAPAVFAVDIPSGAGGDVTLLRDIDDNCVTADVTLTFHARKPVHMQYFAKDFCGEIIVVDIGIDEDKLWNPDV